ncbi:MAG: hypothetical protein HY902_15985, partial [Deltaproteobacteria bacterium]|nr:hypothetical protein [Deltaproteobacteria bacterium]
ADTNTCTQDVCGADNKCSTAAITDCCTAASQCNDSDPCTVDSCNAGLCSHQNTCCKSDAECNDNNDKCTIDTCVAGACKYTSTGAAGCCLPTLYTENFDGASAAAAFVVSNNAMGVGWGPWNPVANPPGAKSGTGALYYGNPSTKTFSSGSANSGSAKSTKIAIPATAVSAALKFNLYMDTEPGTTFDLLKVYVYADGVKQPAPAWAKTDSTSVQTWGAVAVDLTAFKGKSVEFEFWFDTVDGVGNSTLGVLIDDVAVVQTCQ